MISIAMTTFNGEAYVAEQIKSLLQQDFRVGEIVVCDDDSSDHTVEIIRRMNCDAINLYVNDKNLGYIRNFERACSLCRGEFIALCDQDDIWEPNKLSNLLEVLIKEDALAVFSDATLIDSDGIALGVSLWESKFSVVPDGKIDHRALYMGNCVTGCTMLFRRELLDLALPFPEGVPHDWWLAFAAAASGKLYAIQDKLVRYRIHGSNTIGVGSIATARPIQQRLQTLFRKFVGRGRISRYAKWHDQMRERLDAMYTYEKSKFSAPGTEISALNQWINSKQIGSDMEIFRDIFFGSNSLVLKQYYNPGKRILEPMSAGLRRLKGNRLQFNVAAAVIVLLVLSGMYLAVF